ncbi:hypothetical protein Csa_012334 [Cucumis sativus]|uniref:Uncharacterized protein n=1 Tax=Cucumis sativus TaxID=3659 RepID=A0A0A0L1H3_CUCSA|nr:hypothetical protein Csa_012334 [Cucumis sativus]
MTSEVAIQLMRFIGAKDLWEAITQDFVGVQSRVEENFLQQTSQTTRKDNSKMEDYLHITKMNADNLSQTDSLVPPQVLSYVLLELNEVYNMVIAVVQGKPNIS